MRSKQTLLSSGQLGMCIPKEKVEHLWVRFWSVSKSPCGCQTSDSAKFMLAKACSFLYVFVGVHPGAASGIDLEGFQVPVPRRLFANEQHLMQRCFTFSSRMQIPTGQPLCSHATQSHPTWFQPIRCHASFSSCSPFTLSI